MSLLRFLRDPRRWRGDQIRSDVDRIQALLRNGLRSPKANVYVARGERLIQDIDKGWDPDGKVEAESRDFLRESRERFSDKAVGRAARRAGYSSVDDALDAMRRGKFDPFA